MNSSTNNHHQGSFRGLKNYRVILSAVLCLGILGAGAFIFKIAAHFKTPPAQVESAADTLIVDGMFLQRDDVTEWVRGFGMARPIQRAEIAAQVSERVSEIPGDVRPGDFVIPGQVLVKLEKDIFRNEVNRAESLLKETHQDIESLVFQIEEWENIRAIAEKEVELARAEYERARELRESEVVSQAEVDRAESALQQSLSRLTEIKNSLRNVRGQKNKAEARLQAREAEIRQAQINLDRAEIKAPFAGHIENRLVDTGDLVSPGQTVFVLVDDTRVEIPIEIPASRIPGIKKGAGARLVSSSNPSLNWTGEIARISPVVSERNRTVTAYLVAQNSTSAGETPIRPGAFLVSEVKGRDFQDVFAIPREAIVDGTIYLLEDGIAKARKPNFFVYLNEVALTRDPLPEGEILILNGFDRLYDGAPTEVPSPRPAEPRGEGPEVLATETRAPSPEPDALIARDSREN